MDGGAILEWIDKSPTLAGIVATVIGGILTLLITSGAVAIVKKRPPFQWIQELAGWIWAHRPTTMARLNEAVSATNVEFGRDSAERSSYIAQRMASTDAANDDYVAPGHGLGDHETHVRMSDQRHVVRYREGLEIGVITPSKGRFMALHVRNGEAGPFDSIQSAVRALWELD